MNKLLFSVKEVKDLRLGNNSEYRILEIIQSMALKELQKVGKYGRN